MVIKPPISFTPTSLLVNNSFNVEKIIVALFHKYLKPFPIQAKNSMCVVDEIPSCFTTLG